MTRTPPSPAALLLAALLPLAPLAAGCDDELDAAIEELRAAAPDVCKDYCEGKVTCEWPDTVITDVERRALASAVQRCEIGCAYDMGKGAYAAQQGAAIGEIEYVRHVSGAAIEDALSCAVDADLFSCPDDGYAFGGLVPSQCVTAEACVGELGIDRHLAWSAAEEACATDGTQWLDAEYF